MRIEPLIKSRPTYAPVAVQPRAQLHLFIASDDGLPALEALIAQVSESQQEVLVFTQGATVVDTDKGIYPMAQLAETVGSALMDAPISSAVYIAGNEAFLWDIRNLARSQGFADEQIQMCEPVNNTRRLFCTHCYAITEDVTHSPHTCSGCGRWLLVRDHYSKLHAAYVGVQINAENPSELPETEELV
ncbi:hypothetical protein ADIMK_1438 [Marinobacterium lacunae]|uniref:Uncharacterized protein n=1 Tax=Marinobacterium lacunae TaxID=1232683 RepID=A0A081G087_9GAMM|nr:dimethylamine monooxygenase subunit DmmA family protein [Marinobacterium lacunae]KEA64192.1 hypothetical protein ADIMK_1438 [Marinobacterium lacunae]MBR9884823.1 hypothetical protein [Oceanospirillales bacterium]